MTLPELLVWTQRTIEDDDDFIIDAQIVAALVRVALEADRLGLGDNLYQGTKLYDELRALEAVLSDKYGDVGSWDASFNVKS